MPDRHRIQCLLSAHLICIALYYAFFCPIAIQFLLSALLGQKGTKGAIKGTNEALNKSALKGQ